MKIVSAAEMAQNLAHLLDGYKRVNWVRADGRKTIFQIETGEVFEAEIRPIIDPDNHPEK